MCLPVCQSDVQTSGCVRVSVLTPAVSLCRSAAAEPHRLHTGRSEVAAEKPLQLLHKTLFSFLRYTHTVTQTKMSRSCCTCQHPFFFLNCGTGSDLLKLTRDDLVQICGPADGIRLFNALKSRCVSASAQLTFATTTNMTFDTMSRVSLFRSVRPRLTVYVCQESPQESPLLERHSTNENGEHSITSSLHGKKKKHRLMGCWGFFFFSSDIKLIFILKITFIPTRVSNLAVYHALYLEELTAAELIRKMASVCNLPLGTINQVYRQGPTGIHILLSDQVRTNAGPSACSYETRVRLNVIDGRFVLSPSKCCLSFTNAFCALLDGHVR